MAYQNNDRGPLVPGQTISVNKYTIQIERYLSKGGYAYVYLVRTPQPVNGTTQHVLKRIAVPNEGMLAEVKKEVDIMRILRGHPNIVQLIDAAWHRLPNGVYEIFILMEFCSGGGIIDMMNRRLRERLTESEILQIFVDTCEGVAAMHNLRPALLHRDLKVENILQSSATLFKLCDFGSATPAASRPPANTTEIRALETDLNRHTTLQYRAPEMVDAYLRRPIDEKSDVWALGVLLYKLCYYTTPFEEHGPLAILNVQYKIPSYPVYSGQMNALIGSMLREHGAQRPTVFDLLDVVHRMRGTKSRFTYTRASAPAPSSAFPGPTHTLSPPNTQAPAPVPSPNKNAGVQAREKVLEAIAPMRRGRPAGAGGSNSRAPSPSKDDREFRAAEEASWARVQQGQQQQSVRGHRSGLPSPTVAWGGGGQGRDDAWATRPTAEKVDKADRRKTFQVDALKGFGDSFEGMLGSSSAAAAAGASTPGGTAALNIPGRREGGRDAFYGLGISPNEKPAAPTLAEARRLRTGLATSSGANLLGTSPSATPNFPPRPSPRPSPAPQLRPTPSPQPISNWTPGRRSPQPPQAQSSWKPSPSPSKQDENLTAEERFPSLEDLDRQLSPPTSGLPKQSNSSPQLPPRPPQYVTSQPAKQPSAAGRLGVPKPGGDGVRSEHVTGAAMRAQPESGSGITVSRPQVFARPSLVRRHRSSISIKPTATSPQEPLVSLSSNIASSPSISSSSEDDTPADVLKRPPSAAEILGRPEPGTRDWLTGSDDESAIAAGHAVLRGSPSKRASVLMNVPAPAYAQAQHATHDRTPTSEVPPSLGSTTMEESAPANRYNWRQKLVDAPSSTSTSTASSSQQARQQPTGTYGARTTPTGTALASKPVSSFGTGATKPLVRPKPALSSKPLIPAAPVASQSSTQAEALSDNWSPVETTHEQASASKLQRQQRSRSKSKSRARSRSKPRAGAVSSGESDEGPEDAAPGAGRRARAHGRQSSVHDLVGLWDSNKTGNGAGAGAGNGANGEARKVPVPEETAPPPSPVKGLGSSFTRVRELAAQPSGTDSSTSSSAPRSRPRPQSMMLSSTPLKAPAAAEATGLPKSLGPPPNPRANAQRRTSISDMVHKYEALNSPTGPGPTVVSPTPRSNKIPAPTPNAGTKPSITKVASHGTASSILPSPRTGTFAVPASPMQSRSRSMGTALTAQSDEPGRPSSSTRTGGAGAGAVGLPGLASPGAKPPSRSMTLDTGDDVSDRKPFALPQPQRVAASPAPFYEREREREKEREAQRAAEAAVVASANANGNGNGDGGRSPSPDKPYQGVGRLIDQWQRKTGPAADGKPASGVRKAGVPVAGRGGR